MKTKEEIQSRLEWIRENQDEPDGRLLRGGYELALLWVLDLDIG